MTSMSADDVIPEGGDALADVLGGAVSEVRAVLERKVAEVDGLRAQVAELHARIVEAQAQVRRCERLLELMTGEVPVKSQGKGRGRGRPRSVMLRGGGAESAHGKRVGQAALERVWQAVQELAQVQDDFTQPQVRARLDIQSSTSALAFQALREQGRIRFTGQRGNMKTYRLTREALQEVNGGA
jgi:hypothetical protein